MHMHLRLAELLTDILENRFVVGKFRFGIDPLLGLVPFLGDIISFLLGSYLVWVARRANLPTEKIKKMYRNLMLDLVLGMIPFFGDMFDFAFRSHSRNLKILQEHMRFQQSAIEGEILDNSIKQ